ncbi:MAG: deoxyuridine 5'-triphosphate nucleotidohydrolase [Oscillospiraceae bacterium]|nr:deoxyuridine 5'-triphosphate nucleotidohydrolase [Oscillospiraceae bacterium]
MAERIAGFYRVSPQISGLTEEVPLPRRATSGSAGYDFFAPYDIDLAPMETAVVPTGIRCRIDEGWFLMIAPRSGLGCKYRLSLDNTVGIIDSDYYHSDNEGHIIIKMTNCTTEGKTIHIPAGTAFAQGIFLPYGITCDDDVTDMRNGGFGSTTKG